MGKDRKCQICGRSCWGKTCRSCFKSGRWGKLSIRDTRNGNVKKYSSR